VELEMEKVILIDPEKCTGCRICEIVCSLTKEGVINPTRSRIQVVKVDPVSLSIPVVCQQCYDAPCIAVCPVGALSRHGTTGMVNHDRDLCIGCKSCAAVCPFGAIGIDTSAEKVFKCDLCGGEPTCVKFCETKALEFVEASTLSLRQKRKGISKYTELLQRDTGQSEA
jgi:carbon-monoxide dehydrogenase iron sulfur subunit